MHVYEQKKSVLTLWSGENLNSRIQFAGNTSIDDDRSNLLLFQKVHKFCICGTNDENPLLFLFNEVINIVKISSFSTCHPTPKNKIIEQTGNKTKPKNTIKSNKPRWR